MTQIDYGGLCKGKIMAGNFFGCTYDWSGLEEDLKVVYQGALVDLATAVLDSPCRVFKLRRLQRRVDRVESILWAIRCARIDAEDREKAKPKLRRSRK
jgi:hypothetical protein